MCSWQATVSQLHLLNHTLRLPGRARLEGDLDRVCTHDDAIDPGGRSRRIHCSRGQRPACDAAEVLAGDALGSTANGNDRDDLCVCVHRSAPVSRVEASDVKQHKELRRKRKVNVVRRSDKRFV